MGWLENEFNPAPKPSYKRGKPTRKQKSTITAKVRKEVKRRSGEACERCGRTTGYFEAAHLIRSSQGGSGREPWNIAYLCGPSTNPGTCHNFADYTAQGREWRMQKREALMELYIQSEWM